MAIPETILGMKTILVMVLTASAGGTGAVGGAMFDHVTDESAHLGTQAKLDYLIKEVDKGNEKDAGFIEELQNIRLAICSLDNASCKILKD